MKTTLDIEIPVTNINLIRFKSYRDATDNRSYLWAAEKPEGESYIDTCMLTDVNATWGSGQWYIFAIVDCAFPLHFAVLHACFEDAYEEFCDWQVDRLKIEEPDLKDYDPESLNYSGNGVPIDTESIQGWEVKCVEIKCNC